MMELLKLKNMNIKDLETITISMNEYKSLVHDSEFLDCLSACGVDDWEGYEHAQEMMDAGVVDYE